MTKLREIAIENARQLAQQVFEDQYALPCRRAYYVERDGRITTDEFVGNFHERESVYYGKPDAARRLATYGLNGAGYNGSELDYRAPRVLTAEEAAALAKLPDGHYGDSMDPDEVEEATGYRPADTAYYIPCEGWTLLDDEPCAWTLLDIDNPSDPLVEAIEAIEHGFFADEA